MPQNSQKVAGLSCIHLFTLNFQDQVLWLPQAAPASFGLPADLQVWNFMDAIFLVVLVTIGGRFIAKSNSFQCLSYETHHGSSC